MKVVYCRGCAMASRRVFVELSHNGVVLGPCPVCKDTLWSERRFVCARCLAIKHPMPDVRVSAEPPARTTPCVRGHEGPWAEDPDSAWALGGVRNRIRRPDVVDEVAT